MAHVHMHRGDLDVIIRMLDKAVLSIKTGFEGETLSVELSDEVELAESIATVLAHISRGRKMVDVEFGHYEDDENHQPESRLSHPACK